MRSYVLSVALACIAASAAAAGSPHNGSINSSAAEVLALGQKAVRTWLQGNTVGCGWEDGTFMIGEGRGMGVAEQRAKADSTCCAPHAPAWSSQCVTRGSAHLHRSGHAGARHRGRHPA
jgi:hypothetical protein